MIIRNVANPVTTGIILVSWFFTGTALAEPGPNRPSEGREGRRGRKQRMMRDDGAPKAGDIAPTLKLKMLDGKKEVDLTKFQGKRPVVLFFGSYT